MEHSKKPNKGVILTVVSVLVCVAVIITVYLILDTDNVDTPLDDGTESNVTGTTGTTAITETEITDSTEPETTVMTTVLPPETTAVPPAVTDSPVTTVLPVIPEIPYVPSTEYVPPADRNTDFSGCLFIGDSRTQGFMLYSGVSGAVCYAARGLMVDTFFTSPVVDINGEKISVADALKLNTGFERVYIMFGVNELGWVYDTVFRDNYARVIDHVKAAMPNTDIYIQSIIPVTASKSATDGVYNNENISRYNGIIRDLCAEKGVNYVDLTAALCGEYSALPEDAATDGIHLKKPYCQRWLDILSETMY